MGGYNTKWEVADGSGGPKWKMVAVVPSGKGLRWYEVAEVSGGSKWQRVQVV